MSVTGDDNGFLCEYRRPVLATAHEPEPVGRYLRICVDQVRRLAEDKALPIHAAVCDLGYAQRSFAECITGEARLLGLAA